MQRFKADLHIHTLLSPCGSLEMSPVNIIKAALKAKLDIIGICDHNSTKQASLIKRLAKKEGLFVLCGAEVNTIEEVHCLVFFETDDQLIKFQSFLDLNLIKVDNNPEIFGEQVVVDENEMIIEEVSSLLINSLKVGLLEIEQMVHAMGGIVIPAHVDRPYNGLLSQMGFVPDGFKADAFELSKFANTNDWQKNGRLPSGACLIKSSDAHMPEQIGQNYIFFEMVKPEFKELRMALNNQFGREISGIDHLDKLDDRTSNQ